MTKRAAVVGSGISGLVAAAALGKRGVKVTIVEKATTIGGLLSSIVGSAGDVFDFGTHVPAETGLAALDRFLFASIDSSWNVFANLHAGSYLDRLNDTSPFLDITTLDPDLQLRAANEMLASTSVCRDATAGDLFVRKFGQSLAQEILDPIMIKLQGRPARDLYPAAAGLFGLTRVKCLSADAARSVKALAPAYDDKFAFHSFLEGPPGKRAFYPKVQGVGLWVDRLTEQLTAMGVTFLLGHDVMGTSVSGSAVTSVRLSSGQVLECDSLVWALPASQLLEMLGLERPVGVSKPEFRFTTLIHVVFDRPFATELHYITNYRTTSPLFRVTLYPNLRGSVANGRHAATLEILTGKDGLEGAKNAARFVAEMREMGIVETGASLLYSDVMTAIPSFPVMTPAFIESTRALVSAVTDEIKNVSFVGRTKGEKFFMKDILTETFQMFS